MPQDPSPNLNPTTEELAENLKAGLEALPKGREATDAVYDQILAKRREAQANEDRPEFWRDGEPMPEWAEESARLPELHWPANRRGTGQVD